MRNQFVALFLALTLFFVGCADGDRNTTNIYEAPTMELSAEPYSVERLRVEFGFVNDDPMFAQLGLAFRITANEPIAIQGAVVETVTNGLMFPRIYMFAANKSSGNIGVESNTIVTHLLIRQDDLILEAGEVADFYVYFNSQGVVDDPNLNSFFGMTGLGLVGYRLTDPNRSPLPDFGQRVDGPIFPEDTSGN